MPRTIPPSMHLILTQWRALATIGLGLLACTSLGSPLPQVLDSDTSTASSAVSLATTVSSAIDTSASSITTTGSGTSTAAVTSETGAANTTSSSTNSTSSSTYTFSIVNQCDEPIWPAAAVASGSAIQVPAKYAGSATPLNKGDAAMVMQMPLDLVAGRIWARTGCNGTGDTLTCTTGNCVTASAYETCQYDDHCASEAGAAQCGTYDTNEDATLVEFGYSNNGGQDRIAIDISRQPGSFGVHWNVGVGLTGTSQAKTCADENCAVPEAYVNVGEGDSAAMTDFGPSDVVTVTFCPSG